MCGRVRDPGVEEVSEIRLNHFRSRWRREVSSGDRTPGSLAPVVFAAHGERIVEDMRWGLIPAWSESDLLDYSTYNARSERISQTPTYRGAWRKGQRCLIPAQGFYERKYFFFLRDAGLMMIAGLWDEWKNPIGGALRSYTMLTTRPNELVARAHDRMPVIIARADWATWLGEEAATEAQLLALLKPCPADLMDVSPPPDRSPPDRAAEERQMRLL